MIRILAALGLVLGLAAPTAAQSQAEVTEAFHRVTWAWNSHEPCGNVRLCATSFETFGDGVRFNDGTVAPFAKVQRLATSAHECIQNARRYLAQGDRGMAVQWVMAAQMHDASVRDWLRDHPDAVIAALRRI